ncbi:MAG: helix-turn-helix domain-containing protein, partial [Chloroflexota bacterium]|nr:helix-turn-helix domain-containing protein [Chloroflexota bacterium]
MTIQAQGSGAPPSDPLDEIIAREAAPTRPDNATRQGRPRSDRAHRDITKAFRELLIKEGFDKVRMEHVAARAKVGKATVYRHWPSKQALAQEVLLEL